MTTGSEANDNNTHTNLSFFSAKKTDERELIPDNQADVASQTAK